MSPCLHIAFIDPEILYGILGGIAIVIGFLWDNRKDQQARRESDERHRQELDRVAHDAAWRKEVEMRIDAIENVLKQLQDPSDDSSDDGPDGTPGD